MKLIEKKYYINYNYYYIDLFDLSRKKNIYNITIESN